MENFHRIFEDLMDILLNIAEDMIHNLFIHHSIKIKALQKWVMTVDGIYLKLEYYCFVEDSF